MLNLLRKRPSLLRLYLAWTLSNAKMDRKLNALLLGVKLPPRPSAWHL